MHDGHFFENTNIACAGRTVRPSDAKSWGDYAIVDAITVPIARIKMKFNTNFLADLDYFVDLL